jgi:murein L,D-transpeptidase YafK
MFRKSQQMPREIFLVFNLLALFIITYILVDTFYRVINLRLFETGDSKVLALKDGELHGEHAIVAPEYAMIVKRNIFGATEKADISPIEEKETQVEMLQETGLALSLIGTIAGDTEQSSRAIILDKQSSRQDIYRVGDPVQDAVVSEILRGKIVLRHGEKEEKLSMGAEEDIFRVATGMEQRGLPSETTSKPFPLTPLFIQKAKERGRPYISVSAKSRTASHASQELKTRDVGVEAVAAGQQVMSAKIEPRAKSLKPEDSKIPEASPGMQKQAIPAAEIQAPNIPANGLLPIVKEPGMPAAKMPDFAAVEPFLASWAGSWGQKNVETYLSHYSSDFSTPGGMSRAAWEKQRHDRLRSPQFIKINIRKMREEKVNDTLVQVAFIQEYKSNIYSDRVMKTLELKWENGSWMITKETSMPVVNGVLSAGVMAKVQESGTPATELHDFASVEPFVSSWAEAWKQKNANTYLSCYSRDFSTPGGTSRAAWEKQRHERLGRPRFIQIDIREMKIQRVDDSRVQVAFIQEYRSDIYSDIVLKTLELIWENGGWMIARETSLAL